MVDQKRLKAVYLYATIDRAIEARVWVEVGVEEISQHGDRVARMKCLRSGG